MTSVRGFRHVTLREIVYDSAAGSEVRVQLTNRFGRAPLRIGRAAVALQGSGAAVSPRSAHQLHFEGSTSVTIPPGADVLSDPVPLAVSALSRLAVSVYLPDRTGPATQHVDSHETNFLADGAHVLDPGAGPFSRSLSSWYFLDAVDVLAPPRYLGTVVALGDSITAGVGSALNADANWPDDLARRLDALPGDTVSVVDAGIGGNRVLNDSECCGVDAVARFGDDALRQDGVRAVILLEGINDILYSQKRTAITAPHTNVTAAQIIDGDEQIIGQAHAAGVEIYGATLLPFKGARYWTQAGEAKREAINRWIRTSHAFDGVIDFDQVMKDPSAPLRLNPAYDSGDHLHPNDAGYRAMAAAIDLGSLVDAAR